MATSTDDVKKSIKIYLCVFGALAVLTVITVLATKLHIGIAGGIALALLIASVKGSLVASYFMHLIHERTVLYWIIGLCGVFFVLMILLPVLQTSETAHLMDPIYEAAGETPPVYAAPAEPAAHGAGVDHGGGH